MMTPVIQKQNRADAGTEPTAAKPPGFQGFQYSSGAFQTPRAAVTPAPVRSATPPKQPRGRLFVVTLVVAVLAFGGHKAYEALFRYSAYGVVAGRVIQVPATIDGLVQYVHVEEGESVRQGQVLLTLHAPTLEWRIAELDDELRMAQAKLHAGMSRLKWELSERDLKAEEAIGEFYEKWGQTRQEQARLTELQQNLQRAEELFARKVCTIQDVQKARLDAQGQHEKVEQLLASLTAWKNRAEAARDGSTSRRDELLPMVAEIESIEGRQDRLRCELNRQQIRSPVNGVVTRRHRFTGEGVAHLQPLFTIVEEDSLHIELFVSQDKIDNFAVGDRMEVQVAPFGERVLCRVARLGDEHVFPPPQIERYYPSRSTQLPIILQPESDRLRNRLIQVGAVVKLPWGLPRWTVTPNDDAKPADVDSVKPTDTVRPNELANPEDAVAFETPPTVAALSDPAAEHH